MRKKLLTTILVASLLINLVGCESTVFENIFNKKNTISIETYGNNTNETNLNEKYKDEELTNIKSNSNLHLQKLAKKLGKYEYANDQFANTIPIKVSKHNNNLILEKDKSSCVFLYTIEKFNKNIKSGLLISILPNEEKYGDKTYYTFKISSINLIKNGGTGIVAVGRIYNDGTIEIDH